MNHPPSRRSLTAFRQLMTGSTKREIETAFIDEGFVKNENCNFEDSSERRVLTESFISNLDWNVTGVTERFIRVMETLLAPMSPKNVQSEPSSDWDRFVRWMNADDWIVEDDGSISAVMHVAGTLQGSMATISDVSGINEGLERLRTSRGDTAASIGASKELVESTAKVILRELGETDFDALKFPQLIREVQQALGLDPKAGNIVDGEGSIKRILGGATSIVLGLNEFRNAGHGTGHGPDTARKGLSERHASLAINAAVLWCDLALSTYSDPQAPWRKRGTH